MNVVIAILQVIGIVMAIGTLIALGILLMASIENWMINSDQKRIRRMEQERCAVCQNGAGVLINEDPSIGGYWPMNDWCAMHTSRIGRIRKLERELLDNQE